MWIRIRTEGQKISIPVPLVLAGTPLVLRLVSRYGGEEAAKYVPYAGEIIKELRSYVARNGHFTLVDVETSDGTWVKITV